MLNKYKPCPFCGRDAKLKYWRLQDSKYMLRGSIGCNFCGVSMGWSDIRYKARNDIDGESEAILKWNKRI